MKNGIVISAILLQFVAASSFAQIKPIEHGCRFLWQSAKMQDQAFLSRQQWAEESLEPLWKTIFQQIWQSADYER